MPEQARLSDLVDISCPHGATGIITTGSEFSMIDGLKCARLTDTVTCISCGQTGNIVSGSEFSMIDALKVARKGDTCVGTCDVGCKTCPHSRTGTISTGSQFSNKG